MFITFTKITKILLSLALLVLLLVIVSSCCQAGDNYPLSESELTRLQAIFGQLEALNKQLSNELSNSKKDLTQLQSELQSYKKQLTELQQQLEKLQAESTQLRTLLAEANNLLEKARKSFLTYQKEVESRIRRLTIQRNVCIVFGAIMAFLAL